jgi:hypothetical protein
MGKYLEPITIANQLASWFEYDPLGPDSISTRYCTATVAARKACWRPDVLGKSLAVESCNVSMHCVPWWTVFEHPVPFLGALVTRAWIGESGQGEGLKGMVGP